MPQIFTVNREQLKGHLCDNLTLYLSKCDSGGHTEVKLTGVLVVQELSDNLVSVDALY